MFVFVFIVCFSFPAIPSPPRPGGFAQSSFRFPGTGPTAALYGFRLHIVRPARLHVRLRLHGSFLLSSLGFRPLLPPPLHPFSFSSSSSLTLSPWGSGGFAESEAGDGEVSTTVTAQRATTRTEIHGSGTSWGSVKSVPICGICGILLARAPTFEIATEHIRLATLEDLILLKLLAARAIDRADIADLVEADRDRLDRSYVERWAKALGILKDWDEIPK